MSCCPATSERSLIVGSTSQDNILRPQCFVVNHVLHIRVYHLATFCAICNFVSKLKNIDTARLTRHIDPQVNCIYYDLSRVVSKIQYLHWYKAVCLETLSRAAEYMYWAAAPYCKLIHLKWHFPVDECAQLARERLKAITHSQHLQTAAGPFHSSPRGHTSMLMIGQNQWQQSCR